MTVVWRHATRILVATGMVILAGCGAANTPPAATPISAPPPPVTVLHVCKPKPLPYPPPEPALSFTAIGRPGTDWSLPLGPAAVTVRFAITQWPGSTVAQVRFQIAPVNSSFPGSAVRTFPPFGKDWAPGAHHAVLSWDGTDDQGHRVPAGRYRVYAEQHSTVPLIVTCADGSGQGVEEHTGTQWAALGYLKVVGPPR